MLKRSFFKTIFIIIIVLVTGYFVYRLIFPPVVIEPEPNEYERALIECKGSLEYNYGVDRKCLAAANDNVSMCGTDQKCRDNYYLHKGLCNDVIDSFSKSFCFVFVNNDNSYCYNLKGGIEDLCFTLYLAFKNDDVNECNALSLIGIIDYKEECMNGYYFFKARKGEDVGYCEKISSYSDTKTQCFGFVTQNETYCMADYAECVEVFNLTYNVDDFCEETTKDKYLIACKYRDDPVFVKCSSFTQGYSFSLDYDDFLICLNSHVKDINICNFVKRFDSVVLCKAIVMGADFCDGFGTYSEFSRNQRNNCYFRFAEVMKDISVCENIDDADIKDRCKRL